MDDVNRNLDYINRNKILNDLRTCILKEGKDNIDFKIVHGVCYRFREYGIIKNYCFEENKLGWFIKVQFSPIQADSGYLTVKV